MNLATTYSAMAPRSTSYAKMPRRNPGRTRRSSWPTPSPASSSCRSLACAAPLRSGVGRRETATPAQIFAVSCEFGVGYATLLTHLSAGVDMLSRGRAAALGRVTPKALRVEILGELDARGR